MDTSNSFDQLFVEHPHFLNEDQIVVEAEEHYCNCKDEAGPTDDFTEFYTINCNITTTNEFCDGVQTSSKDYYTTCSYNNRKKRSTGKSRRTLAENDDFIDFEPLTYAEDVLSPIEEVNISNLLYG